MPGRQRGRHRNAAVDTHHGAIGRPGNGLRCVGERDVPATGPITGDAVELRTLGDRPRQAKPDPADLGYPHPSEPPVQTLDVMGFDRDLPKALMHTGFAPGRSTVGAVEKVTHRLREIPQRLLLHSLRARCQPAVFGTGGRQTGALLVIAGRLAPRLPVPLLLYSQIPYKPGVATVLRQQHRLLSSRNQSITRHPCNLTVTTDKPPNGNAVIS